MFASKELVVRESKKENERMREVLYPCCPCCSTKDCKDWTIKNSLRLWTSQDRLPSLSSDEAKDRIKEREWSTKNIVLSRKAKLNHLTPVQDTVSFSSISWGRGPSDGQLWMLKIQLRGIYGLPTLGIFIIVLFPRNCNFYYLPHAPVRQWPCNNDRWRSFSDIDD